ncbi:MAG: hypothetical protein ACKOPG_12185 [Novosphingobium sp.]
MAPTLRVLIDGAPVETAAVEAWEDRRMRAVRKQLGLPPSTALRDHQQAELVRAKLAMGHAALHARFARQLRWSERFTRISLALARGKRRMSICEIAVSEGSAERFAHWFDQRNVLNDEAAMLAACPDHFIIARDDLGRQLVMETTGGSPLASEFTVDYEDTSSLVTPADPAFPFQVAGVARLADGLAIGGVRHQFRQEGAGFRARLTVEFPSTVMEHMAHQHCWHLAVEFSNWIKAVAREA